MKPPTWLQIEAEGKRYQKVMTLAEPAVTVRFLEALKPLLAGTQKQRRDGQHIVSTPDGKYLKAQVTGGRIKVTLVTSPDEATHLPENGALELGRHFFKKAFLKKQVTLHI